MIFLSWIYLGKGIIIFYSFGNTIIQWDQFNWWVEHGNDCTYFYFYFLFFSFYVCFCLSCKRKRDVSVGMLKWNPHPKKENIKKIAFFVPRSSHTLALTLISASHVLSFFTFWLPLSLSPTSMCNMERNIVLNLQKFNATNQCAMN